MGTEQQMVDYGVTLIEGRGKLVARDMAQVDPLPGSLAEQQQIGARNVIIATGSVPAQLPIEGADLPGVLGTEEAIRCSSPCLRCSCEITKKEPTGLSLFRRRPCRLVSRCQTLTGPVSNRVLQLRYHSTSA